MNENQTAKFNALMETLPAILATVVKASAVIVAKSVWRHDGSCQVYQGQFLAYSACIDLLAGIRRGQQVPEATAAEDRDRLYVPVYGQPHLRQAVVQFDAENETETRTDSVNNLYHERRAMDRLIEIGVQIAACGDRSHAIKGEGGRVVAYWVPAKYVEYLKELVASTALNGWRPGEVRSAEVAAALAEALGKPAVSAEEIMPNTFYQRLMPRASEAMTGVPLKSDKPEAVRSVAQAQMGFDFA